jgi:hypothetical protein
VIGRYREGAAAPVKKFDMCVVQTRVFCIRIEKSSQDTLPNVGFVSTRKREKSAKDLVRLLATGAS